MKNKKTMTVKLPTAEQAKWVTDNLHERNPHHCINIHPLPQSRSHAAGLFYSRFLDLPAQTGNLQRFFRQNSLFLETFFITSSSRLDTVDGCQRHVTKNS
jgi:hypothetical protein